MTNDPILALLGAAASIPARVVLYAIAVFLGSAIPQFFGPVTLDRIIFGFPLQYLIACIAWEGLFWIAWFSAPALIYYLYRFIHEENPKMDFFAGFSVSFITFYSFCIDYYPWPPLLIYAAIWFLYWKAPRMLVDRFGRNL